MALPETIDYVIVHELAHLKEMNHSKKFWAEVDKMNEKIGLKNYKVYKKWLRENGRKINFE
jgi:predicted metal-dependent hydrolase